MDTWLERVGALHAHSRYSDGASAVPEILDDARAAGLDFLVLTDHDSFSARREGWEGTHRGVTLLVAAEITPWRKGHLLAMQTRRCCGYAAQETDAVLNGIQAQGGYAVVAHPMGKHKPALAILHAPWRQWEHPAVRGLEIWSYTHDWVDEIAWWRLPAAYEFWKHPEQRVRGPEPEVLRRWDRLGRTRRLSGMVGLDCHARRVPLTRLRIFAYERMFRFARNHIFVRPEDWLSGPVAAVWRALAEGRLLVAHDILADAAGARCEGTCPDGERFMMGAELPFRPGMVLSLCLPRKAEVRWLQDGGPRLEALTDRLEARPAGPGVYRFEARLGGRPWVFGNPFYLR